MERTLVKRHLAAVLTLAALLHAVVTPRAGAQDEAQVLELISRARAAEDQGDADSAETFLRQAFELDPKRSETVRELGRVVYVKGEVQEGLALLYRALELAPKDVLAATLLIDALLDEHDASFQEGDAHAADDALTRARAVLDTMASVRAKELELRRIRVLTRTTGQERHAAELALGMLEKEPADLDLHAAYVEAITSAKGYDEALAWYEKAACEPWLKAWFTSEVHVAHAHYLYNHYSDDDQAVKEYLAGEKLVLEAARLKPDVFDSASERAAFDRSWAGWTLLRNNRYDEAWDLFVSAWGRDPSNTNCVEGMSTICARLMEGGKLEQARDLHRQLCTMAPDRADFWNNYGLLCRDTGQFEESYRAYRRAMALAPEDPRIVNDCALILQYHLKRDLDLCERWLIHAEDLARKGMSDAVSSGDDAAQQDQLAVLGDVLVNLARLFADQGRMQESAEHWNELRAVDAKRPELPENQGGK